ncbi:MAG: hypothetical protein ACREGR_03390, partial [Minisyncoccia bacterium]
MKKARVQASFLVELRKVPIVQVACEKLDLSRNSVYRWRKEDEEFAKAMDEALEEGEKLVNDMTESQLLSLIGEQHWPAISFWLRHRNAKFRDRLEVTAKVERVDKPLSPEEEELMKEGLRLALPQNSHE